jgi:Amt family ammonium transporter
MRRFIGKMPEVVRARSVYGGSKPLNGEAIMRFRTTGLLLLGALTIEISADAQSTPTPSAVTRTMVVAASFAGVTWLVVEWAYAKQPKFVGLLTGTVAGLATITPAAGYVSLSTAALIGILAGLVCYYAVALKNRLGWDDALDVWGVHGVGGFLGIVLLGMFASTAWNPNGVDGLLLGGSAFFGKQCVAVIVSAAWAFGFTYGMLWLIDHVTVARTDAKAQKTGLDAELHGEEAYPQGL